MPMNECQHDSSAFVVRIWWEGEREARAWRGWVQHVTSGHAGYFRRLVDLLDFIEAHTGALAQSPAYSWARGGGGEPVPQD